MIHELRTYTFHSGKLPAYLKLQEEVGRPVRGNDYGICHGYWSAEFGQLNQVWHLWSYDSLDDRERQRQRLSQNKRWTGDYVPNVRPLLIRQDIRFLNPVKPINPPKTPGGVYELRIYRMNPGMAGPWSQAFRDIMPVREKYSQNVGIWTGEAPQPNEVAHMWSYPDLNSRMTTRAAVFKDQDWLGFVSKNGGAIAEMQSTLLIPTSFSPMQ